MTSPTVNVEALRAEVREKYREVADDPNRSFHFHTGRGLAARLGYRSEAAFARAFKRVVGMPPGAVRATSPQDDLAVFAAAG